MPTLIRLVVGLFLWGVFVVVAGVTGVPHGDMALLAVALLAPFLVDVHVVPVGRHG